MAKRGRKRKFGSEDKAVFEWEKHKILPENLRDEMETMWEIPQIYHFLQLTKEAFNITHLSMYEVERMLLMPKASKQLAHIMTCLLSSPSTTKSKLQKVPPMPYAFWTNILMYKLKSWFKVYQSKRQDPVKTFDTLGIEPEFWTIFPDAAAIEGRDFQDFTFRQRVWLLKNICDTAMYSRKTIQDEISKQPCESQFETILGIDRYGARYIYFPQFLHNDLRVYKHCLDNKVLSTVQPPVVVEQPKPEEAVPKQELKPTTTPRVRRKKRRSRWSNGTLPPKKPVKSVKRSPVVVSAVVASSVDSGSSCERSSRCSSKASELSAGSSSCAKSSGYETNEPSTEPKVEGYSKSDENDGCGDKAEESMIGDDLDKSAMTFPNPEDSLIVESAFTSLDDLSKSSKTDDEKLEEISSKHVTKATDKSEADVQSLPNLTKDVNISKSDDEKLSESKKCDSPINDDSSSDELSLEKWMKKKFERKLIDSENEQSDSTLSGASAARRSARIKHISEIKLEVEDAENMVDMCESEELASVDLRDNLCRVSSPEEDFYNEDFNESDWKVDNFNELISDLSVSHFQLVADSLDSLKDLIEYIFSNKTIPGHTTKENFIRPTCEVKLLKRMERLTVSLEKVESILKESTKKARNKLQREWNNFENGMADEDQEQHGPEYGNGANCWLVGPQGGHLEQQLVYCPSEQRADAVPRAALSTGCAEDADADGKAPPADTAAAAPAPRSLGSPHTGQEEAAEGEGQAGSEETAGEIESEARSGRGGEKSAKDRRSCKEEKAAAEKEAEEPRQTRRVLRARGVSSYTEQLFTDDESDEEKLDGWADIEAIYAPASASADASAPDTPAKAAHYPDSYNESDEEDSDQDWILPSSRKRKSKRPSASRRLKSFQHKLQNIQDANTAHEQQQQPQRSLTTPIRPVLNNRRYTRPLIRISNPTAPVSIAAAPAHATEVPIKTEPQDPSLHSVLDIKDEGPIYDAATSTSSQPGIQQNYVVVTAGQAPVTNYYVMQQNQPANAIVQQNQFIQPTTFVSQMPQVQTVPADGYYVQPNPPQNYIVQNPAGLIATAPRQTFIASSTPVVYQQQPGGPRLIDTQHQQVVQTTPNYVQYVTAPMPQQQQQQLITQQRLSQPRIINTTTLTPPRQMPFKAQAPGNRVSGPLPPGARQNFPHPPNGAVIRSSPLPPTVLRPGQRVGQPRNVGARRQIFTAAAPGPKKPAQTANASAKPTSLIVLSDSDDEIEMIVPETSATTPQPKPSPPATSPQLKKNVLPPELLERVNEGSVSISPIKPAQPAASSNSTQLVVVVNETGSHYALALPNGSKLILTPEQVAQIRASNGGKLVL